MKSKKRILRAEVDKVRLKAGLQVWDKPLIPAKCEECSRVYYYRTVPLICPWPSCGGKVKEMREI